jgi:hypothetical protein
MIGFGRDPALAASPSSRCASSPFGLQSGVKERVMIGPGFANAVGARDAVILALIGGALLLVGLGIGALLI